MPKVRRDETKRRNEIINWIELCGEITTSTFATKARKPPNDPHDDRHPLYQRPFCQERKSRLHGQVCWGCRALWRYVQNYEGGIYKKRKNLLETQFLFLNISVPKKHQSGPYFSSQIHVHLVLQIEKTFNSRKFQPYLKMSFRVCVRVCVRNCVCVASGPVGRHKPFLRWAQSSLRCLQERHWNAPCIMPHPQGIQELWMARPVRFLHFSHAPKRYLKFMHLLRYKSLVENELKDICKEILGLLNETLVPIQYFHRNVRNFRPGVNLLFTIHKRSLTLQTRSRKPKSRKTPTTRLSKIYRSVFLLRMTFFIRNSHRLRLLSGGSRFLPENDWRLPPLPRGDLH